MVNLLWCYLENRSVPSAFLQFPPLASLLATTLTARMVGLVPPCCSSAPMSLQRDRVPAAPHGADRDFSSTSHIGTAMPWMDRLALLALALL